MTSRTTRFTRHFVLLLALAPCFGWLSTIDACSTSEADTQDVAGVRALVKRVLGHEAGGKIALLQLPHSLLCRGSDLQCFEAKPSASCLHITATAGEPNSRLCNCVS